MHGFSMAQRHLLSFMVTTKIKEEISTWSLAGAKHASLVSKV
jgi:hypothetical protein